MVPNPTPDSAAVKAVAEAREALAEMVADYKHANYQPETGFEDRQKPELPLPWHHRFWNEQKRKCCVAVELASDELWAWLRQAEIRELACYLAAAGLIHQAHLLARAGHPEDALAEAERAERVLTGQSVAEQAQGRP